MKIDTFSKLSLLLFIFSFASLSCGVKGVPLPPLTPTPIGKGEISKPRPVKPSKKFNKYQYNKYEESDEFSLEEDK